MGTGHRKKRDVFCTHLVLIPYLRSCSLPLNRWHVRRGKDPKAEEITRTPENRLWDCVIGN